MSETATLLKLGTTALVLAMLEDGRAGEPLRLADPVGSMHLVSRDVALDAPLRLVDGRRITALEIQWELHSRATAWSRGADLGAVGGESACSLVLDTWQDILEGLEHNPMDLANRLDWVAKYRLLSAYKDRHGIEWNDNRLRAMDLQYHDLRPGTGLASRLGLEQLVATSDVLSGVTNPPEDTRAFFRGRCLERFPDEVVAANWDSVVFDVGGPSLQRVPMMEPGRGTQDHVGDLIERSGTAVELLAGLGA